jgi:ElaB/YqjD/DUF883 family membrane-anchored ribosome-binding protein
MASITPKPGNTKDRLEETATSAAHKAQEAAQNLGHRAQETAQALGHRAQEAASTVGGKVDEGISAVGGQMSSLGGTIRQSGPREGMLGSATGAVADRLQEGGRYLQEHGLSDMADDMTAIVRRYPMQSLCVGFGVGFLLGYTLTRR